MRGQGFLHACFMHKWEPIRIIFVLSNIETLDRFFMLKKSRHLLLTTHASGAGFRTELTGTVFRFIASGSWTIREAAGLDGALKSLNVPIPPSSNFTGELDLTDIETLDTAGAWLLQRTLRAWEKTGLKTSFRGAKEEFHILLNEVARSGYGERPQLTNQGSALKLISDCINTLSIVWQEAVMLTGFLGALTSAIGRCVIQPWRFRPISFVHHLEHTGLRAVPIISLICLLIGAVIMQQSVVQLERFGAETFSVNMVGLLGLREVGILLTAIMVAGRSGSAFTAEIGSMKMREEIDAMRTLGIDPMETLVVPRVLALIVVLPLLTFLGDIMCLIGGGIMAQIYLGLDMASYIDLLHNVITIPHFLAGMIKAPFAALIIGLVGCREGLAVKGSAESLGFHVTSAVVKAIFLVIILDALFAMFLSAIGV